MRSIFLSRLRSWRAPAAALALAGVHIFGVTALPGRPLAQEAATQAAQPGPPLSAPGPMRQDASPAGKAPAAPAPRRAAVLVVNDGLNDASPLVGAEAAVRRFNDGGAGRATLVASTAAKAEENLRALARDNPSVIIITAASAPVVEKIARETPGVRFTIIGSAATGDNIRSIQFRDEETDWLAGWLAGRIAGGAAGFIGLGADPKWRLALCAASQGLAAATPQARLLPGMLGADVDPGLAMQWGAQLARNQADRGASVILTPGGPAGAGAMNAIYDAGLLAVTHGLHARELFPHNVLATRTRNYESVVLGALAAGDHWTPGNSSAGLAQDAVSFVLNREASPAPDAELRTELEAMRDAIASGTRVIRGLDKHGACPMPGSAQPAFRPAASHAGGR